MQMDEKGFKDRVTRLKEVNDIIEKLDTSIRAAAFALLESYITEHTSVPRKKASPSHSTEENGTTMTEFFASFSHEKPADNANLLAAHHFREYGSVPFTIEEMKALATEVGVTIPDRLDMTYVQAKRDGKNFFSRAGRGAFKPTVHGELFFKKTYSVAKGKKPKAAANE
jgi:hypothetical protein